MLHQHKWKLLVGWRKIILWKKMSIVVLIEPFTLIEDEHQRKRCYLCRFPSVWISPTVTSFLSCFSFRILFPFPHKDIYCLGDFFHDIFQILWRTIVWRLLNHKIKRHFVVYWGNEKSVWCLNTYWKYCKFVSHSIPTEFSHSLKWMRVCLEGCGSLRNQESYCLCSQC